MKAVWNGTVIAQSDQTIVVESNHYFPRTSIVNECFIHSKKRLIVPGKAMRVT